MIAFTDAQKRALHSDKNIIVEAGAGSGKTTLLTHRYLSILNNNPDIDIQSILAITFTKKAAAEMLCRVNEHLQSDDSDMSALVKEQLSRSLYQANITTIHGLCVQLLKQFPLECSLDPNFIVIEKEQATLMLNDAIQETMDQLLTDNHPEILKYMLYFKPDQMKKDLISLFDKQDTALHWIHQTIAADSFEEIGDIPESLDQNIIETTKQAFCLLKALCVCFTHCLSAYNEKKALAGCIDYHDILAKTADLLQSHQKIRTVLKDRYHTILIDEFQDTDPTQWQIIQYISGYEPATNMIHNNLFIVGDYKQAIYSFRGANPDLFHDLIQHFSSQSNCEVVQTAENFRSCHAIIQFVNDCFDPLFQASPSVSYTPLKAIRENPKSMIEFAVLENKGANAILKEADYAAKWIQSILAQFPNYSFSDIALLFRRKKNMAVFKDVLEKNHISAEIYDPQNQYLNEAVIFIITLCKALLNQSDNLSWIGVIQSPLFGVSHDAVYLLYTHFPHQYVIQKIIAFHQESPKTLAEMGFHETDVASLTMAADTIPIWVQKTKILPLYHLVESIFIKTNAYTYYADQQNTLSTITAFLNTLKKLSQYYSFQYGEILKILQSPSIFSLWTSSPIASKPTNKVQLLSVHAAKGLEFPVVLLPECNKTFNFSASERLLVSEKSGIGLSFKTQNNQYSNYFRDQVYADVKHAISEEEKRVLYVACTRAKDHLLMLGAYKKEFSLNSNTKCFFDLLFSNASIHSKNKTVTLEKNPAIIYPMTFE